MVPLVKEQPPSMEMVEGVAEATMVEALTNPILLVQTLKEVVVDLVISAGFLMAKQSQVMHQCQILLEEP
jgi:predicted cation transporter